MTIEILMATYNGEKYLREQIDSILNQTDKDWHLTISDDGSTDNTPEIIKEYQKQYPERIDFTHSGKRFGNARDHFFWMMEHCNAEWVMFSDQDDVFFPEKIQTFRQKIQNEDIKVKEPVLVFSDQTVTDSNANLLSHSLMDYQKQSKKVFDYRCLIFQNVVTGGALMASNGLVKLALQCTDVSKVIMHDWWLAIVAARFGRLIYVDKPLSTYRQHEDNSVGAKRVDSFSYTAHMLLDLKGVSSHIQLKKGQSGTFLNTYKQMLNTEDYKFLKRFAKNKSGAFFYWNNRKLINGKQRLFGLMILG